MPAPATARLPMPSRRSPLGGSVMNPGKIESWPLPPDLVAKRYHPAFVRFYLHEGQGDILVEPVEERVSFPDRNGHDQIANFVSQSESKAFTRDRTASDEPN